MLYLHDRALSSYGGMSGMRDQAALEGALARPVNALIYAEGASPDVVDLAAIYASGIVASHPFFDGNKRTAWASCVLFLKINGIELSAPAPDVVARMVALAQRQLDEPAFAIWLSTTSC